MPLSENLVFVTSKSGKVIVQTLNPTSLYGLDQLPVPPQRSRIIFLELASFITPVVFKKDWVMGGLLRLIIVFSFLHMFYNFFTSQHQGDFGDRIFFILKIVKLKFICIFQEKC